MTIRFGSACSGIEAASVAFHPLGWETSWVSEIEPFPCAVLRHHYPTVPNLGDMRNIAARVESGEVEAPDVLCGGCPCQDFSISGLRKGLIGERGQLSLHFCNLANVIDKVRKAQGKAPCVVFFENVEGLLSDRDNAFGCILAGLTGEDVPLVPAGRKWTHAGVVFGPARTAAWVIKNAEYFGLAQRRRRVFIVASAAPGFDPCEVLFEFDGVRRDSPPRREKRESTTHDVAPCIGASGRGFERAGETRGQDPVVACYGANDTRGPIAAAAALNARGGSGRMDFATETFCVDFRNGELDSVSSTLQAGGKQAAGSVGCTPGVISFHPTQDPIHNTDGSTHALSCGSSQGQCSIAVAVALRGREGGATAELGDDVGFALRASSGGDKPHVLAAMQVRRLMPLECARLQGFPDYYTMIPWHSNAGIRQAYYDIQDGVVVDAKTEKKRAKKAAKMKPASQCPDGPQYRALGNSWACPVVRWIGSRIDRALIARCAAIHCADHGYQSLPVQRW